MTVLIAGAGVGGLTLALMLKARGIKCVIYEQASEVREVGVGINTLPHAIKELAALDLLPALDAVAIRTKELIYINRLGQGDLARGARHRRRLRVPAILRAPRPAAEAHLRRGDRAAGPQRGAYGLAPPPGSSRTRAV